MLKPILEEGFSNWVQARETLRDIRRNTQERALRWYGLNLPLPEYRREATTNVHNHREGWLPGELCQEESGTGLSEIRMAGATF